MPDQTPQSFAHRDDAIRRDDFRRLYEMSSIGIFRSTADGRYVMANPAGARMHGYDSEAELLRAVRNIAKDVYVDAEDRETMRRLLEEQGFVEGFECEILRHKTRERIWVRQNVYRIMNDAGRPWYLEGYVEDISDRKRVEKDLSRARDTLETEVAERTAQLRATNQALRSEIAERRRVEEEVRTRDAWLRAILENAPIEVVLKDTEGRIMAISDNVPKILNAPKDAFLGTTTADHLPPEIAEIYMAADRRVVETGEPLQREVYEETDGKARYSLSQKFPMRDAQGAINGICSLTSDITEMKEAELRLAQAQKMEAVGQLTSGIAHDFNNLIAIIQGNIAYLDRKLEPDSPLKALTAPALRATRRGASLTQRLLAFARRQPLEVECVDIGELLTGLSEMLGGSLGEDISLELSIAPDLRHSEIDPGQLEQAIVNLANNGRDAMPDGGALAIAAANVRVCENDTAAEDGVKPGDYVMVTVTDDGMGMTAANRKQIFDPFYTTKGVGEGTGLGLSMVLGFVEQSGGHVTVSSEPGKGTTFRLYLPPSGAKPTPGEAERSSDVGAAASSIVLVVEDDDDLRAMTVMLLSDIGYRVLEARSGRDALALLKTKTEVDLVLTDVVLPDGMNGPQMVREARRSNALLKAIYMSGYAGAALARRGGLADDEVLVQKPFEPTDLERIVGDALTGG